MDGERITGRAEEIMIVAEAGKDIAPLVKGRGILACESSGLGRGAFIVGLAHHEGRIAELNCGNDCGSCQRWNRRAGLVETHCSSSR